MIEIKGFEVFYIEMKWWAFVCNLGFLTLLEI